MTEFILVVIFIYRPPSVETYALNGITLFCHDCVDQHFCECNALVDGFFNVIKKPQVTGTNDNVDQLNKSDSMSISIVEDPIS